MDCENESGDPDKHRSSFRSVFIMNAVRAGRGSCIVPCPVGYRISQSGSSPCYITCGRHEFSPGCSRTGDGQRGGWGRFHRRTVLRDLPGSLSKIREYNEMIRKLLKICLQCCEVGLVLSSRRQFWGSWCIECNPTRHMLGHSANSEVWEGRSVGHRTRDFCLFCGNG